MHLYWRYTLLGVALFCLYALWDAKMNRRECWLPSDADPYTQRDGTAEAKAVLARGQLIMVTYGLPGAGWIEYRTILSERYGIEMRTIAGCVVTSGVLRYAERFNAVMEPEIRRRYGDNVFDAAEEEAGARYSARTSG
jgi:hypothetical protein